MIKLDKTKSYYLCDLSEEQKDALCKEAGTKERNRSNLDNYEYMCFDDYLNMWLYGDKPNFEVVNALELFYTLENVQVDCRELSEEQIKEMFDIYINKGYEILYNNYNFASELCIEIEYFFIKQDRGDVFVGKYTENKHTITYDKFMELFSKEENINLYIQMVGRRGRLNKEENVLTEIMKDEYKPTFCETYKSEKPQHYSKGIDTFKRMEENCTLEERLAFAKGNIDKYTWRTKGQDKEDFVKIVKYAEWALKQLENEQSTK